MEALEYDHAIFNAQQAVQDATLFARFYIQPLRDDVASAKEGRPIYNDTEMVEIRVRGDRNNIVIKPVTDEHRRRFRQQYDDFKRFGENSQVKGTPLKEWPIMSASMAEELKFFVFQTVEQVAEANDAVCSKMPGLTTMKNRAKIFLEFSKGAAPAERLQGEVEKLTNALEVEQRNNRDLQVAFLELERKFNIMNEQVASAKVPGKAIGK